MKLDRGAGSVHPSPQRFVCSSSFPPAWSGREKNLPLGLTDHTREKTPMESQSPGPPPGPHPQPMALLLAPNCSAKYDTCPSMWGLFKRHFKGIFPSFFLSTFSMSVTLCTNPIPTLPGGPDSGSLRSHVRFPSSSRLGCSNPSCEDTSQDTKCSQHS